MRRTPSPRNPEIAAWLTSKIRFSQSPLFSSMNSTSSGKNSGSSKVLVETLQKTALMREEEPSRRSVWTLLTRSTLSMSGIMPAASAAGR